MRYLRSGPRDRDEVREWLRRRIEATATAPDSEGDSVSLAVVLPETGAIIGNVVLFTRSREHRQGEVGIIVFHPGHSF